jgi:hypothetical protein
MSDTKEFDRCLSMELAATEEALFSEWSEKHARYSHDGQFIMDGIVRFPTWQASYPKLLFLLKEANDPPNEVDKQKGVGRPDWNLAQFLGTGVRVTPSRGYKKLGSCREVDSRCYCSHS